MAVAQFQYNTCFYLSVVKNDRGLPYFLFQYNTCFYLSFLSPNYGRSFLPFQYNTCFYLSDEMEEKSYKKKNFNTTLVFIYRPWPLGRTWSLIISIQHLFLFIKWRICHNTERRNISIQHLFLFIILLSHASSVVSMISIQHLFLFILGLGSNTKESLLNFNTTLVFIYLRCQVPSGSTQGSFQYNTCFYLSSKSQWPPYPQWISIQHLFLFIFHDRIHRSQVCIFQYNTCFYLSVPEIVQRSFWC